MIDIYKEIDWSKEIKEDPSLEEYIKKECNKLNKNIKPNEHERPIHNFEKNLHIIGIYNL